MPIITTEAQLLDLVAYYKKQTCFAFDVETWGSDRLDPLTAPVSWLSLSTEYRTDVIPMGHPNGELKWEGPALLKSGEKKLAEGKTREELRPSDFSKTKVVKEFEEPPLQLSRLTVMNGLKSLFFDEEITKIGHNIKFDLHALNKYYAFTGIIPGPYFDTLIASWILDSSLVGKLSLAECVHRELLETMDKTVGKDILQHSFTEVADYSWRDADATYRLYKKLKSTLDRKDPSLTRLLSLEHNLLYPVMEMERTGVLIDRDKLEEMDKTLRAGIDSLQSALFQALGREVNFRSNPTKQEILFGPKSEGNLELKPLKVLPSAAGKKQSELSIYDYAVDKETLDHYSSDPVVTLLLMYAAKMKLHSSYVLPYLGGEAIRDGKASVVKSKLRAGRIYGQFNQHGTESGRFSSRNPSLQTIPSRTAEGKKLRELFIADPGYSLIIADYSQIEPRIIASLSGDQHMINTYQAGGDVYQAVADRMGETRAVGKELVLSMAYGVGAARIASRIGCTEIAARSLMQYFNERFPDIKKHKIRVIQKARRERKAVTIFGRERPLPQIAWSNEELRATAERQAYNHLIQGSAADIMKIAMVNVHSKLLDDEYIVLTVHDELVVLSQDRGVTDTVEIIREEMEAAGTTGGILQVPLVVDISVGKSWGDKK